MYEENYAWDEYYDSEQISEGTISHTFTPTSDYKVIFDIST